MESQLDNQQRSWLLKKTPPSASLESELKNIPSTLRQILSLRGIREEDQIQSWLDCSLKNLKNPLSIKNMDKAVARLSQALKREEKIGVYGDFDLDGTSGVTLLLSGLSAMGFKDICYYQPKRLSEGYGFHFSSVEKWHKEGVSLIVTVDVGITDSLSVSKAQALGVDVIVTDHHLPKGELPEAVAVVNPNLEECSSGLGYLCGTGVAFYLIRALGENLKSEGLLPKDFSPEDLKDLLDVFTIATLTDMVPLKGDNRPLVKHGIHKLAKTQRLGLKELLNCLGLGGRPLSENDVAIRFAPKLNALSRMEMGTLPIDVFLAKDKESCEQIIQDTLEKNEMRRQLQKQAEEDAQQKAQAMKVDSFVWVYSKDYHKGVVGLVATKLAEQYGVPAFVGSCDDGGSITASARAPDSFKGNLVQILSSAKDHLTHFGGHALASGFSLKKEKASDFAEALKKTLKKSETGTPLCETPFYFDAEMDLVELSPSFEKYYDKIGPFGVGFETPVFCFKNLTLVEVRSLKGGHLKLKVRNDRGNQSFLLWFFPSENHYMMQEGLKEGLRVDALAELQWNYFAGKRSLQLLLKDIRPAHSSSVEH